MINKKRFLFKFKDNEQPIQLGDIIYYSATQNIYSKGTRTTKMVVKSAQVYTISSQYINNDRSLNEDVPTFIITDDLYSSVELCQKFMYDILNRDLVSKHLNWLDRDTINKLASFIQCEKNKYF
jgi:hypothetical protein